MLDFLITVYRANPFRPHCNSSEGKHTFLCRLIMPKLDRPAHPGGRHCDRR